ncbi:hypothetical protein AgCh_010426 [Apium graveolens]
MVSYNIYEYDAMGKCDLSLVDKEYDPEDSNLKFLLALPEKWDLKATTIRDNYELADMSLDEIYGMLKTHELEMEQRKKRHGGKSKTFALKTEEKPIVSRKAKGKALIIQSDSESSDSDDDDSEPENLSEVDVNAEMMQLCALMVKGITKIAYKKFKKGKKFSRKGGSSDKKEFRKTEGKGGKSDRGDNSNVKCFNYDTSESEEKVNYTFMANADSSSDAAELKNDYLKTELEKEREIIKTWTNSGRTNHNILSSGNWKEGLGYKDGKSEKGTLPIKPKDKPALVNIGLMTKKQLKYKLKEIKNMNKGNRKNILVLESGCSGHMTGNKAMLSDFVEKAGPGVSYGDGNMGKTLGYGNINLGNVIIESVALVSGLKHNLLSVSQICDRGYHVDFFKEHCEVVNNSTGKVVLKGYRHVKKDLVRGLPKSIFAPDGLCDSCQKAKQRKSSFKSKTESSILEPYHLLHVDLFGLVNVMSIAKKKYAMVIVDEFTRYTWVYFLHKKNETASTLTDHVRQLDKLLKDSVKIIRSDNGIEFKNSIMEEFCKEHGIKHEFPAPGTPQQNGVVERKNRTLIEATQTMLDEAKLPTYFWAEAVQTAYFT